MNNIKKDTIIRTIVLVIALVNQALTLRSASISRCTSNVCVSAV